MSNVVKTQLALFKSAGGKKWTWARDRHLEATQTLLNHKCVKPESQKVHSEGFSTL